MASRLLATGMAISLGLSAASCHHESQYWSQTFSDSVERTVANGKPVAVDERVPCQFQQLIGRFMVSEQTGAQSAVVVDRNTGQQPPFPWVHCFKDNKVGTIIVASLR